MTLGTAKLKDMSLSRSEARAEVGIESDLPEFPYGLSLHLDTDSLAKLDIELPAVGDTFFVVAIATVKSVSEHESNTHKSQDVTLQIEKLSLDSEIVKA